jgi:hypothetical protein
MEEKQAGARPNVLTKAFQEFADDFRAVKNTAPPVPTQAGSKSGRRIGVLPEELRPVFVLWRRYQTVPEKEDDYEKAVRLEKINRAYDPLSFQLISLWGNKLKSGIADLFIDQEWGIWRKKG